MNIRCQYKWLAQNTEIVMFVVYIQTIILLNVCYYYVMIIMISLHVHD